MPTGEAQPVQVMPAQINVSNGRGLYVSASVMSDGTATDEVVATSAQEIVDLMQSWAGRTGNVTCQFYVSTMAPISPTDPEVVDPPPPPPEG